MQGAAKLLQKPAPKAARRIVREDSPGSVIDCRYEAMDGICRSAGKVLLQPGSGPDPAPVAEPALSHQPPAHPGLQSPDATQVQGRNVWLVHPWALGGLPADLLADAVGNSCQTLRKARERPQIVRKNRISYPPMRPSTTIAFDYTAVVADLKTRIASARLSAARAVNPELVGLYQLAVQR